MPKKGYKQTKEHTELAMRELVNVRKNTWFVAGQKRPFMLGDNNPAKRPEVAKKISEVKFSKPRPDIAGEKSKWWKGGITPKNHLIRRSVQYRIWRKAVFERDDYTCKFCKKRGIKIHADHIKSFSLFPRLRFAIDNGRTLCIPCHKITDTYLNPKRK